MNIIGAQDALVSDTTTISDFGTEAYDTIRSLISDSSPGDFIWELGRRVSLSPSEVE